MAVKQRNQRRKAQKKQTSEARTKAAEPFADSDETPEAETIADLKKDSDGVAKVKKATKSSGAKRPKKGSPSHRDRNLLFPERMALRERGGLLLKLMNLAFRLGLFLVTAFVIVTAAMVTAATAVPSVVVLVGEQTGGLDGGFPLEIALVAWGLPSLFVIGLLFVVFCAAGRWVWRKHLRIGDKMRDYLLQACRLVD